MVANNNSELANFELVSFQVLKSAYENLIARAASVVKELNEDSPEAVRAEFLNRKILDLSKMVHGLAALMALADNLQPVIEKEPLFITAGDIQIFDRFLNEAAISYRRRMALN